MAQIPKVVGGINPASGRAAAGMYAQIVSKVVPVTSTRAAEMVKLLENIFRCVNIALVNELKQLCLRMGLDIWEVIDSAATKPFGFMPFYPGPDSVGTASRSIRTTCRGRRASSISRRAFIELAGEINTEMPYHVVNAVGAALNERQKSIKGSKILLLGVAYKKDVDDLRESPSLKLLELLTERGAMLDYNDPYFPALHKMRHYDFSHMRSVELTPASIAELRLRADRDRSYKLRLRGDRPRREAGGGLAQRDAARQAGPRKDRPLLRKPCCTDFTANFALYDWS